MLELIASGRVRPQDLIGRVIGLEEAADALIGLDEPTGAGLTVVRLESA